MMILWQSGTCQATQLLHWVCFSDKVLWLCLNDLCHLSRAPTLSSFWKNACFLETVYNSCCFCSSGSLMLSFSASMLGQIVHVPLPFRSILICLLSICAKLCQRQSQSLLVKAYWSCCWSAVPCVTDWCALMQDWNMVTIGPGRHHMGRG